MSVIRLAVIKFLKELREKLMMTYHDSILARSFSRYEQKKLGYGAFIGCFVMTLTLCTVFKPYLSHLTLVNLGLSMSSGLKMFMSREEIIQPQQSYNISENILNLTNSKSQVYEMKSDIRIHGKSSTILVASTQQQNTTYNFTTKPYARQQDGFVLEMVTSFKIIKPPLEDKIIPHCTRKLTVPAIVFSTGGYAGNTFHDFTDVLIPLYLTSRQFNGAVLFLVTDKLLWWIWKYKSILDKLTKYEVIDIDNEDEILCFSRVIVGLKAHKEMSIDPSQSPHYSATDFTKFLRSTYSLDRNFLNNSKLATHNRRPRLLMVSRHRNRHIRNEAAVVDLARNLGFDVDVGEMGHNLSEIAKFVNTFDVMVGVHGAGFTNMVFLPENAVAILIDPFGVDFLSESYFQIPAKDMNLKFLEYKVSPNESSLLEKYPLDSEVFTDPEGINDQGWMGFRSIYLDNQDVNLDLGRFKKTLLKALELVNS